MASRRQGGAVPAAAAAARSDLRIPRVRARARSGVTYSARKEPRAGRPTAANYEGDTFLIW